MERTLRYEHVLFIEHIRAENIGIRISLNFEKEHMGIMEHVFVRY